jgi:hypothetical protein
MRILINGFHWGGNTPPFVKKFKELGHDVKLICPYGLSKNELLKKNRISDDLILEDILFLEFNTITRKMIKLFQLLRIFLNKLNVGEPYSFLLGCIIISRKINFYIKLFKPDIILNHSFSIETYMVLTTGFKPQISFPFGSDIISKSSYRNRFMHRRIIKESTKIISVLPNSKQFYLNSLDIPPEKISEVIPIGLPNLFELINNRIQIEDTVNKYNLPQDGIKLLDVRALRRIDGGVFTLLKAVKILDRKDVYIVFTKGYLGNDKIILEAKKTIANLNLDKQVTIINEELNYRTQISLMKWADIGLSLLPHDVLGKSIMEYISQGCQLILTDLQNYRILLQNNAEYVRHNNVQDLIKSLNNIISLSQEERKRRIQNNINWLIENQDFGNNCEKLINLFIETKKYTII